MPNHRPPAQICLATTELATGGAEKCLVNLACGLSPAEFSVRVLSLAPLPAAPKDSLLQQLQDRGIPVDTLNVTSIRQFLTAKKRLRNYLADHRVELLQTFLYHCNVLGSLARKKLPALLQVSGIRVADPSRWRQLLERNAAKRWNHTACVSQDVATFCANRLRLGQETITVIPNGIDAEQYANNRTDRTTILDTDSDRRWLLTIGRLENQKGLDWLLKLAPTLLRQAPQHDLVIVGDGSQRFRLEQRALQSGIADRVHFLGWRPDIPQLLGAADLLLLPSRWEGMPNVLLEAMASSLPVVALPVQGVEQILGDLGELQIARDSSPTTFIELISHLLGDSDLQASLGRQNRGRILANFTITQMVKQYSDLYRQLLPAL